MSVSLVVVEISSGGVPKTPSPCLETSLAPQGGELDPHAKRASDRASNEGPERRRRRRRMRLCLRSGGPNSPLWCWGAARSAGLGCPPPAPARDLTRVLAVACPCRNRCSAAHPTHGRSCVSLSPTRLPRRAALLRSSWPTWPPRPGCRQGLLFRRGLFESVAALQVRMPSATNEESLRGCVCTILAAEGRACSSPGCWLLVLAWRRLGQEGRGGRSPPNRVLLSCLCVLPPCSEAPERGRAGCAAPLSPPRPAFSSAGLAGARDVVQAQRLLLVPEGPATRGQLRASTLAALPTRLA